jgi:hypothetical protein
LLQAIANEALPKFYRAVLIDLMQTIFVDYEPNRAVRMLNPICMRSSPNEFEINISGALQIKGIFDIFPELRPNQDYNDIKKAAIQMLIQQDMLTTGNPDKCKLCCSLLSLALYLLKCGKYTHMPNAHGVSIAVYPEGTLSNRVSTQIMPRTMIKQLRELLDVIVSLLDTAGETSFVQNEHTTSIVDAKLQILDMCLLLFDYRLNARMHSAFATYNSSYSKLEKEGTRKSLKVSNSSTKTCY